MNTDKITENARKGQISNIKAALLILLTVVAIMLSFVVASVIERMSEVETKIESFMNYDYEKEYMESIKKDIDNK